MDLKTIKNLLNLISDSDVNEVEIEEGDFKIRVKKQADTIYKGGNTPVYMAGANPAEHQVPGAAAPPPAQPAQTDPASESAGNTQAATENESGDKLITVRSPIVGTFYRSPSPESDSFVNPGDTVSSGDVICIIEAMKIMNEIESEHSGKIVKILAEDSQPVEFDQPLFLIESS